jgi:thiamine transport system ATP-binding protein
MLTVEHLTVRYGDVVAVDALDLTVGDGEIVCVVGPSGSGKSTLLRAIAGLEALGSGRVLRDGADLAAVPPHRRELGLMFQDHALFPHRDVLGNVAFGLRMRGRSKRDADVVARATLARVGLEGYERRTIVELSGGEQQRVALARALAPAPSLLMLDEPLGALDRHLREQLVADLGALCRELGQSVLFVTHDHDEAFGLGDRVAVLHRGRVEQVGTPGDVWGHPATAFVARFLGWNVLEADDRELATTVGRAGPVAIRPDALALDADGPLTATVTARTFRRDHWIVRIDLPHEPGGSGLGLDVAVRDPFPPSVGDRVRLRVEPDGVVALPDGARS